MNIDKCFGYSAECPLGINHYYTKLLSAEEQEKETRCFVWRECYASWKKFWWAYGT
jgi:hypothetical protein